MIIRVVRMTFYQEYLHEFQTIFAEIHDSIQDFEGCNHLELWQDTDNPCIFTTYSFWDDADALEKYRSSVFFRKTWDKVKQLFSDKPKAFSALRRY